MKKNILIAAISLLLIAQTQNCFSQTNVSGGIYANTTWTLANSPYIVVDTVVVFPNVTLTIEPGVVVKFDNDKRLEIRQGTLIAEGTSLDSIIFTSNSFTPVPGIWANIYLNQSVFSKINYCNFRYADMAILTSSDTLIIKNSNFSYNNNGLNNGGFAFIDTCNFRNNVYDGLKGAGIVNSCIISNNQIGIHFRSVLIIKNCIVDSNQYGITPDYTGYGVTLLNSIIKYNQTGVELGNSTIDNCTISNNQTGIITLSAVTIKNSSIDSNSVQGVEIFAQFDSIYNCQIKYNGIGVFDTSYSGATVIMQNYLENNSIGIRLGKYSDNIYCNKICNNTSYDLIYTTTNSVNISNNYWCTTDSATIASHIYDGYDNINLGLVNFMPLDTDSCYLTGCNLSVTANVSNATCDTCHNGSATANVSNGFAPFTYTWYSSPLQTAQTATSLAPGTYALCVTDGNGCTACNNSIFIDSTNCGGISVITNATNATCSACNDGSASLTVNGGTSPYQYTWYTTPMQSASTATGLPQGTYSVCVTDLYGCSVCDSVTVSIGNCSAYYYLYPDTATQHQYYAVNMASGTPPLSYSWSWGDGSANDTAAYPSHTYSSAGFYTICLTITDSAGCTNTHCTSFYLQKTGSTMVHVSVIPPNTTGINSQISNFKSQIFVFPNPFSRSATLEFSNPLNQVHQLSVYSIVGQLVRRINNISGSQIIFQRENMNPGIYFYEMRNEKEVVGRGKMVVE